MKTVNLKPLSILLALSALVFSGCESGNNGDGTSPTQTEGSTLAPGANDPDPASPASPTPAPNPNRMTLAMKYVALRSSESEAAYPTQSQVESAVERINAIWAQCDIVFKLETYESPVASASGLAYMPANLSQLDTFRSEFGDGKSALFVKTGTWNRSGTLGNDGSNGFSTIPPAYPEGIVMETRVAESALLLAHEAGHLIGGLGHVGTATNLMNHYITTSTTKLTTGQCTTARNTIRNYHSDWLR